ncbi:unnamed protein product [Schistosoma margrebowiei]|uniref:Uncharacterized protein n=1 Tax=Schistosoma margrebowiei TaxID=48269 RepID=A0A183LV76_9TREM|nr:unnamed protein product [Schistosoma margrebowiei]
MRDVRTKRRTDNHHLVVVRMKLNLKKHWKTGQTLLQRFSAAFIRSTEKLNEFRIALNNRFQALQYLLKEEKTAIVDNYRETREALTSTRREVLGLKKHHHEEWICIEILGRIHGRENKKTANNNSRSRTEEVKTQAEYIEANKQEKRSIGADKQKYVEELAEKATRERNIK